MAQLTWSHNRLLMDKIKEKSTMICYADKTIENGWSKSILWDQIDLKIYERQAIAEMWTTEEEICQPQNRLAWTSYCSTAGM
jgi:predicted nuclease of restriction endonuclease-like (RecB) superfamily